jgi:glutathione synthase/RimK-type ligase-like ATP-grasp enzyme
MFNQMTRKDLEEILKVFLWPFLLFQPYYHPTRRKSRRFIKSQDRTGGRRRAGDFSYENSSG